MYDFMSADEFTDIASELFDQKIRFRTHKTGNIGPEYFRMQSGMHELELWVHPEDVKKAMAVLNIEETKETRNYEAHATEALKDLIREPLTLEKTDLEAIILELSERGITISEAELDKFRHAHKMRLSLGKPAPAGLIAAGFLTALLGGVLGLIIGFRLVYLTDIYPAGEEFYHYNSQSRSTGKLILTLASISFASGLAAYFMYLR